MKTGAQRNPLKLRTDFPVGRLAKMALLGNVSFAGLVFCCWVVGDVWNYTYWITDSENPLVELIKLVSGRTESILSDYYSDGLYLSILFILGTTLSLLWYIIARRIETRRLKKKWLILRQIRPETPPA